MKNFVRIHMSTLVTVFCRVYTSQCKFQAYAKKMGFISYCEKKIPTTVFA